MSDLNASFTFRLTHEDKAALADLAEQLGCDRGAALRQMISQRSFRPAQHPRGCLTTRRHTFPVRLHMEETQ